MNERKYRIDAFIVGAEKAGTTSLVHYLSHHPAIMTHFNNSEGASRRTIEFSSFINGRYAEASKFEDDFLSAFGRRPEKGSIVLAKNVSLITDPQGLLALKKKYPHCRIIVCLRNPVDRAHSSFWYQQYRGQESLDCFESAIARELHATESQLPIHQKYLERGHYDQQLKALYELFGQDNVHVVLFDDLKKNTSLCVSSVLEFLGLEKMELPELNQQNKAKAPRNKWLARWLYRESTMKKVARFLFSRGARHRIVRMIRQHNARRIQTPEIDPVLRRKLVEYFAPHNRELERLIGRSVEEWDQ